MSVFMFSKKKENVPEEPTLTKEELREIKLTAKKYHNSSDKQEWKYFRRQIWKFARRP